MYTGGGGSLGSDYLDASLPSPSLLRHLIEIDKGMMLFCLHMKKVCKTCHQKIEEGPFIKSFPVIVSKKFKDKFGCPICRAMPTSESWLVGDHLETHTKKELADYVYYAIEDGVTDGPMWRLEVPEP